MTDEAVKERLAEVRKELENSKRSVLQMKNAGDVLRLEQMARQTRRILDDALQSLTDAEEAFDERMQGIRDVTSQAKNINDLYRQVAGVDVPAPGKGDLHIRTQEEDRAVYEYDGQRWVLIGR